MVVGEASINNIMGGIENTGSVRLHNHRRKLKQRFDIIKKLGQGTYGKVQLGINKASGQEVAIKTIKKSKIETEADLIRIRREIQIMSSVQHPNIIHIYEVFENKEKMVLVMEYAAGGELYDYLSERKVLVEEEARRIFRQISTACYYCHKHKICHRDLKLENILLDENKNAKIADFGLSNVFDDQRLLSTFCGSPLYASPEIVKGTPYHGPEVDCWSLGVLLYTLVYGAMPFDGSNFKRLVKQISQGDYFEPNNPSPASPLIHEMLTVNPRNRANIENICAHWWVNEGYDESCLEISEYLANQTPVRLDVLLSLNPPPPQLESDKLVVTGDVPEEQMKAEPSVPTRSQSTGSLMDTSSTPASRRIQEMIAQSTPKRKLETTVSTDQMNANIPERKEKIVKEHTVADITVRSGAAPPIAVPTDAENNKEDVKPMDVSPAVTTESIVPVDPTLQGAACSELVEESKKMEANNQQVKRTATVTLNGKILEEINENPSQENLCNNNNIIAPEPEPKIDKETKADKENVTKQETIDEAVKAPIKKKVVKKKVLSEKNELAAKTKSADLEKPVKQKSVESSEESKSEPLAKPMERRQSRIFEQAEKFQNLISSSESKSQVADKPKKIIIPGVSVGGFKKEFERKASLKSTSPPKLKTVASKKLIIDDKKESFESEDNKVVEATKPVEEVEKTDTPIQTLEAKVEEKKAVSPIKEIFDAADEEKKQKLKNAVSIISNALDKEGTRKSKSRPCMGRKPPVPFGVGGRSASANIAMISSPKVPNPLVQQVLREPEPTEPESQTSTVEITLKSATLPRRKSTKAQILLDYPKPKPANIEFKTEMTHPVRSGAQTGPVMFPVSSPPLHQPFSVRSSSAEPEGRTKERIIPISFEKQMEEQIPSPPAKPPVPRVFQPQKSTISQRSSSLSRQSTQDSDTETTVSGGDPIKKSPREYIIPIAVEGGGYVTPRAGSLEPSETSSTVTNSSRKTTSKFGRPRRMMSLFDRDGSEDESPFGTLHRHSSFGRQDSDTEGDSRKDSLHMHRLRSSRPKKSNLEHTDSLSSGEDDDDDDGFEFLTAENLFSTLLSRVRDLTTRLNDDGSRPGFPNSRLLSHFDHGSNFWNRMEPLSVSRNSSLSRQLGRDRSLNTPSSVPWRRSASRDLASDIDSVFSDTSRPPPTHVSTLPRGDRKEANLNLSDLNLKKLKLTEEDALALSYLTPGLSRRIQKQLFASLPSSEAKKISRTVSMRAANKDITNNQAASASSLPVYRRDTKSESCDVARPMGDVAAKPRYYRTTSLKEEYRNSDSSLAEIPSLRDDDFAARPTRRISRFLRPDFYDPPKDEVKEKKERELETQKVLKEIRDKRIKNRLTMRRERSASREKSLESSPVEDKHLYENVECRSSSASKSESFDSDLKYSKIKHYDDQHKVPENTPDKYEKYSVRNSEQEKSKRIYDTAPTSAAEIPSLINMNNISKNIDDTSRLRYNKSLKYSKENDPTSAARTKIKKPTDEIPIEKKSDENPDDNVFKKPEEASTPAKKNFLKKSTKPVYSNHIDEPNKEIVKNESEILKLPEPPNVDDTDAGKLKEKRTLKKVGNALKSDGTSKIGTLKKTTKNSTKSKSTDSGEDLKNRNEENNGSLIKCKELLEALTSENKALSVENKSNSSEKLLQNVSDNIKNIETNVRSNSKIARPKEKGDEWVGKKAEQKTSKLIRPKSYPTENGVLKPDEQKNVKAEKAVKKDTEKSKNKFLQSIEKKFEKLRTFSSSEDKEKKSGVEGVIKRLRERSVPRNVDHITESTLIKRAVSVEDFSNMKPESLQPSRKSVSKILGLFKKYEDKDELTNINESNIPTMKCKSPEKERPKSLLFDKVKKYNGSRSDNVSNNASKLPVNFYRQKADPKANRAHLKLDLVNHNETETNRNSYTTDDSSTTMLSPNLEDSPSCDSWSVCSDYHHTHDLISPQSPNGNTYYNSGDENESVIDRIRRKSFYSRFNEKKPSRRTTVGNYRDLDLFQGRYGRSVTPSASSAQRYSEERDYKPYARSKSLVNDYVNVPNHQYHYQTYNPRRTNIATLYTSEEGPLDNDGSTATGTYKKYSYNPHSSRLGFCGRQQSLSPGADHLRYAHPTSSASKTMASNEHAV